MMDVTLITGNQGKVDEYKSLFAAHGMEVKIWSKKISLTEIQDRNFQAVLEKKLEEAHRICDSDVIMVEDSGISCEHYNWQLPNALTKFFAVGEGDKEDFTRLALDTVASGLVAARAECHLAYQRKGFVPYIAVGRVPGSLVAPRGTRGFGFDPIFQPEGSTKTWAEMSLDEKNKYSHRSLAVKELVAYLNKHR